MNRIYGISWNLTRSLKLDFNATNYGVIDEPEGRINGLKRDTIWENLKRLGRTTDYGHTLNLNYTVPINKIPGLSWTSLIATYGTRFDWQTEPLITLRDPDIDFGNSIQNSRTIQLNPTLNFIALYNKIPLLRQNNDDKESAGRFLLGLLTSVKNVTGAYNRTEGTFLPGYKPQTNVLGYDFDADAPGWGFLFGSQRDIRGKAVMNGWITADSLQSRMYTTMYRENINFRATVELVRDLRIDLTALRSRSFNYSTMFKFDQEDSRFENQSPITTGDYSVSFFSLRTAFKDADNLFRTLENNRSVISRRLGSENQNSSGTADGYADGYGKNSQEVLIPSFLAAYTGKDASVIHLNHFPKIPVPNWRLTYNGLTRFDFIKDRFASIDINHAYNSTYNVNSFSTLVRYDELNGAVNVRDANGNFLPYYQFSQITLSEQFAPLLGVDMRLKNNMTLNFEYRKSRQLSMSLANSQVAQQDEGIIVFGFGYRTNNFRFPFGLFGGLKLDNDLNFKMDFSLNDRKTMIYRADVQNAEIAAGTKNITVRPSVDYVINQRFNIRLFYDSNITRPYTSQTFNTAFSNFGVSLRYILQ